MSGGGGRGVRRHGDGFGLFQCLQNTMCCLCSKVYSQVNACLEPDYLKRAQIATSCVVC